MKEHHARASILRTAYTSDLNEVVRQLRAKTITKDVAETRFRELGKAHFDNMRDMLSTMPSPGDGVVETVEKCPWCDHVESVVVQTLPEEATEPPSWSENVLKPTAWHEGMVTS